MLLIDRLIKVALLITYILLFATIVNPVSEKSIEVQVIDTKSLIVSFIPIDNPKNFLQTVPNFTYFINNTFPVANDEYSFSIREGLQTHFWERSETTVPKLLNRVYKAGIFSQDIGISIGVVPDGWFSEGIFLEGTKGLHFGFLPAVLVEESTYWYVPAHEASHYFGLCDEYKESTWNNQDLYFLNSCPNGDLDGDGNLDDVCLPQGCPTSTIGKLVEWRDSDETISLRNLMGIPDAKDSWISNQSYLKLLSEFAISQKKSESVILISGTINHTTNISNFDNSYILNDKSLSLQDFITQGNYSIEILNNLNQTIENLSFKPRRVANFFNGSAILMNYSYFVFVLNSSENISSINLKEKATIIAQINKSPNIPNVSISSNLSSRSFDSSFSLIWNGSDADNDSVEYAVLISSDNGTTYSTLEIDYPNESLIVDSSDYPESDGYVVKILATDGFNTGSVVSESFSIVHPPVVDLSEIYSLGKLSLFEFTVLNDKSYSLNNVSWQLDFGDGYILNSLINTTLSESENMTVYVEHIYPDYGEYNVSAIAIALGAGEIGSSSLGILQSPVDVNSLSLLNSTGVYSFVIGSDGESSLPELSWIFETGEGNIISQSNVSLDSDESLFVFLDVDYSADGNYTVNATGANGTFIDIDEINVEILGG